MGCRVSRPCGRIDPARLDPLDRYGLRHLAAHLEAAGREDDLHRLLRLEWPAEAGATGRAGGENAWFAAHDRTDDLDGYMSDVARAWSLADREMRSSPSARALGRQLRSALITASIGSLAANIPAPLLVELVKTRLWPAAQALAFARRIPDRVQRGRALAELGPHLDAAGLPEALAAARGIGDRGGSGLGPGGPAPHLDAAGLSEALAAAARGIGDERSRASASALAGLAPHLDAAGLSEALAAARGIGDEGSRASASALAGLAPHLDAAGLSEALAAARGIGDERSRA